MEFQNEIFNSLKILLSFFHWILNVIFPWLSKYFLKGNIYHAEENLLFIYTKYGRYDVIYVLG